MNGTKPQKTARLGLSYPFRSLFPSFSPMMQQVMESIKTAPCLTERHLHCVWVDNRLRPSSFQTSSGEDLQVLHPGQWNEGAGPDFRNAKWVVNGRHIQGDVEIHLHPMDWVHHGHGGDTRYREVRLHVTYFPGEAPPDSLPKGCKEVALKRELDRRSHFFFESLDLSAYPWDRNSNPSGLRSWFESQEEAVSMQMLEAAGYERFRRKTQRMLQTIQSVGAEQALYQSLMRGLGYHLNAGATEQLATHLPLTLLHAYGQGDPFRNYAALLGSSGLLPHEEGDWMLPNWFSLRSLWDQWWRMRESVGEYALGQPAWRLDHCRPGNHPARRLWAAAFWYQKGLNPGKDWQIQPDESEGPWMRRIMSALQVPPPESASGHTRIIGPGRAAALFVNAVVPWRLATCPPPQASDWGDSLPTEPLNHRAKHAAHTFLGRDAHPRLYKGTLRRQGLLQLAEDYGL